MPELPEVETIRMGLEKYVVGHRILDVNFDNPKSFQGSTGQIQGATIIGVRRVGKGLILDLDNGFSLAIHIKLTGQLIYSDEKTKDIPVSKNKVGTIPNKFTHVTFTLSGNPSTSSGPSEDAKLYYNDQRRFGWIKVLKTEEVAKMPFFRDMGPEPFVGQASSGQALLSLERFKFIVGKKVTKIKPLLMDQTNIGGIGNIYANDALYLAGIDPGRSGKTLTEEEIEKLYEAILTVLKKGFETGGASELSFVNVLGQEGGYQNHTLAYGKKGKCPRCGGAFQFKKLGGRGTYFCPGCQS